MHVFELWEMQQLFAQCPMVNGSKHFTMNLDEFSLYESIPANNKNKVITANGETFIEGKGTVFLQHNVERNG